MLRIHGLITIFVFQFMGNIRRKRHFTKPIQNLFKNSLVMKLDQAVSFFHHIDDFTGEDSVPEGNHCPRFTFLSRFYQCLPDVVFLPLQKQDLDRRIRTHLTTVQPRRDYFCIIDDQAVSRLQVFQDFPEMSVLHLPGHLVQVHQPGRAAVFQRILRDQFLRKVIIKITCLHSFSLSEVLKHI